MNTAKVIGIDACDMVHIDDVINLYCQSNDRKLLNVVFFEEKGMKYMLLITSDNDDYIIEVLDKGETRRCPPKAGIALL